jgi:hypothetical protein
MLKIFNLNGISLQIRSKQETSSASIKQHGMSFDLSEFQPNTLKSTCDLSVHQPQVSIVNHDHFVIFTWLSTYIIMHWPKRSNLEQELSSSRFNFLFLWKTLQSNLSWLHKTFSSLATLKKRPSKDRLSLTSESESGMLHEDLPMRQKAGEVALLVLDLLILLRARWVITGEVKVAESSTRSRHDLLELLLVVVLEAVLLLVIALVVVILLDVVVLVGGVELLPLGVVDDEVGGITALKTAPRRSPPLLVELVQCTELSHQQGDHSAHQKLRPKKTKQTLKKMRQWCWQG